jgi:hypothetical protein
MAFSKTKKEESKIRNGKNKISKILSTPEINKKFWEELIAYFPLI